MPDTNFLQVGGKFDVMVIYHKSDFDGIFCREIAKRYFSEANATYIGWDYGDPVPAVTDNTMVFMLDISVDALMAHKRLVWIDHHKTAMEKYSAAIPGYRIDGVAACRLCYQYFTNPRGVDYSQIYASNYDYAALDSVAPFPFPLTKGGYVNREVEEPMAVRLAGEYDIWDQRDPEAGLFQYGLRAQPLDVWWDKLLTLGDKGASYCEELLNRSEFVKYAKEQENLEIVNNFGFDLQWEGLTFLACNAARYNSQLFAAALKPRHDALLGFNWVGNRWKVGMYHAPGKEHLDLSEIAKKYSGGGHKGACGFSLGALPFVLPA